MTELLYAVAAVLGCCVAAYAVWAAWDFGRRFVAYRSAQLRSDQRMDELAAAFKQHEATHAAAIKNIAAEVRSAIGVMAEGDRPVNERLKHLEQQRSAAAFARAQGHQFR